MTKWPLRRAPGPWHLAPETVYLYRLRLQASEETISRRFSTLSTDEQARAERFKVVSKRAEFVTVRSALRRVLAAHLSHEPDTLVFDTAPHGKPYLREPHAQLKFNVSHSHGLALLAVALELELGIDVEQHRAKVDHIRVARRFFSCPERTALQNLPSHDQSAGFFRCWARKEAVIKANGRGIALGLEKFDVSLHPTEPARLLATRWDPPEAQRWSLHGLDPGPGYSGAVAVARPAGGRDVRFEQWSIET